MKKFLALILAVCLLGVLVLSACGTDTPAANSEAPVATPGDLPAYTGGPAELRFGWWGDDNRATLTNSVIAKFQAAYPDIKVTGEPNGGTADHFAILDTQLQGKNGPDLIQFGGNYPDYLSYLAPLSGYVGKELQIESAAKFDQLPLEIGSQNGELYVVSLGTNTLCLMYNKTILETAGVQPPANNLTWDQFIAYGKELKAKLPAGVFPFVDNSVNQANYLSYYFRQINQPLWTSEEKTFATEAGALDWINLWEDMRAEGLIPDIETAATYAETSADTSSLVAGKTVFGLTWSNQVAGYQGAMTDKLGIAPLPNGEYKAQAIQMSQYLGVNKDSKNLEAAVLFVNFFVNSPEAGEILGTNRGVPCSPVVRTAIAGSASELDAEIYSYYNVIADRSIPQDPNLPNDQEFVDELKRIGQSVAFGATTREAGASELISLIERLMVK
jgi:multiple sugar transport system substrate-binding protein